MNKPNMGLRGDQVRKCGYIQTSKDLESGNSVSGWCQVVSFHIPSL